MCTSGFLFDLRVGPLGADWELFTLRVCAWWTKSGSGSRCRPPRAPVSAPPGSSTSLFLRAGPGLGPTGGTWHWKAVGHLRGPPGTVQALLPPPLAHLLASGAQQGEEAAQAEPKGCGVPETRSANGTAQGSPAKPLRRVADFITSWLDIFYYLKK